MDHPAGLNGGAETLSLDVRIFPPLHKELLSLEVGTFVEHEAATFHLDGVTAADLTLKVRTVTAALNRAALEVSVLEKGDLVQETNWQGFQ